jgi:hypothetical protein
MLDGTAVQTQMRFRGERALSDRKSLWQVQALLGLPWEGLVVRKGREERTWRDSVGKVVSLGLEVSFLDLQLMAVLFLAVVVELGQ